MDIPNKTKENQEFDDIINLLTPKHQRECEFNFAIPQKRFTKKIWAISSVAALFIIVITIAIKSVTPVSAAEVISSAITTLADAESIKVNFEWRGIKTSAEEIYTPDPSGNMINGTLYLLRKNGIVNARIDWHDAEKNSIIFNGKDYIHLVSNHMVNKHSSSFGNELMSLFSHNTLQNELKEKSIQSTDGNIINMKIHKNEITLCGEFQKDNKRLTKASVTAKLPVGQDITMIETKSIETNISIPESIFSEYE
uniref:Uncharacterized protein n=1 Tax=uncultured Muribaculaceae bacterium TaxID=2301481 RepID=A0A6G8F3B9_9BACT|nr:hypothetical protein Muribac1_0340 [uncultured Muribaculaceae bacterium]